MKPFKLVIIFCCLAIGCATSKPLPITEEFLANKDEQILWHQAEKEQIKIDDSGLLYRDAELEIYLNKIAKKLIAKSISPDLSIKIKIVNDPNLNAFAFPNGVIYIHTGILAQMDNEAQLAVLLAHEITHSTHRHSLRVIRSIKDRPAFIAAAQHTLEKIALIQEVARFLGATGAMAAITGYTRDFEATADRVGLDLAVKANYDPREVLKLFEHMKREIEMEGIKEPFFFGTHPNVQQRIENTQIWLATEYQENKPGIKNTEIFQSKVRRLVLDNAQLELRLGRFYAAQRMVEKYLRRVPDDAKAHYLFGEILRQRDRQDDEKAAMQSYKTAISLDPTYSEPHKAMGMIYFKKGKRGQAKKFFESCLLLSPNSPDKTYIQGYLNKCIDDGEKS